MERLGEASRQSLFFLLRNSGPIPTHVAIIMDGNRRFAEEHNIERRLGHEEGYKKFVDVVRWCLELGVRCVSVYAFSIENFKRSHEEVEELMSLSQQKYKELLEDSAVTNRHGAEVRIVGDLSLARDSVQKSAARVMKRTLEGPPNHAIVNICFSYTSSQEICRAVDICRSHLVEGVDAKALSQFLLTEDSPDVDLLIRTSGETRLSDFLLMQSLRSVIVFEKVLWPEYSVLNFASGVLKYIQSMNQKLNKTKKRNQESIVQDDCPADSGSSQEPVKTVPENQQIESFVSDKETKQYSIEKLVALLRQEKQSWIEARLIQD